MRISDWSSDVCSSDLITQGTLDIQSAKADIRRGDNQQVIKLTGSPVKMKQQVDDGGWMNATASQIDYDQNRDTIVFSGNPLVQQPGRGSISGERIIYNMGNGPVQTGHAAGGRRRNKTRTNDIRVRQECVRTIRYRW